MTQFNHSGDDGSMQANADSGEPQWNAIQRKDGTLFLGYRRALEYDAQNGCGQDRCAITIWGQTVIAVLADGVSQSFAGEIAAEAVVNGLQTALTRAVQNGTEQAFFDQLPDTLQAIAKDASQKVAQKPLPVNASERMADVLEEMREGGSQAVFGAFCLNLRTKTLYAALLGDVRLRYWEGTSATFLEAPAGGRFTACTDPFNDRSGVNDRSSLRTLTKTGVEMAWIHSDGVPDSWGEAPSSLSDGAAITDALNHWANKDDASIVGYASKTLESWCDSNPAPVLKQIPARMPVYAMPITVQTTVPDVLPDLNEGNKDPNFSVAGTKQDWQDNPDAPASILSGIEQMRHFRPTPQGALVIASSCLLCGLVIGFLIGHGQPNPPAKPTDKKPAIEAAPAPKPLKDQAHDLRAALQDGDMVTALSKKDVEEDLDRTIFALQHSKKTWMKAHRKPREESDQ